MTDRIQSSARETQSVRSKRRLLLAHTYLMLKRGERHLPPVVRGVMGLLLMLLGILGFLPVLGFWMIPLGLALLATDIPPFRRWLKKQINARRAGQNRQGRTDS